MASPVDDMILDNDNSRDGGSVASATPAPTPAQTPSPPNPTRAPLHSDPTRPPHLCQPCAGDDDGTFPGGADDGQDDVFVHATAVEHFPGGQVHADDYVEFKVATHNNRPRAVDVVLLQASDAAY